MLSVKQISISSILVYSFRNTSSGLIWAWYQSHKASMLDDHQTSEIISVPHHPIKPVIRAARAFLITSIDPVECSTETTLQWSIITSFTSYCWNTSYQFHINLNSTALNYSYTTAQRIKLNDRMIESWLLAQLRTKGFKTIFWTTWKQYISNKHNA